MKKILTILMLLFISSQTYAQSTTASTDALRVYLDCQYYCDHDFVRTEINYLNWVRDQADAQVHVIVSRLSTGGGGNAYTFTFTGKKEFIGREDTLRYTAAVTDSEDAVRRGITQILKIGLVPFIAATPAASRLQIGFSSPPQTTGKPADAVKKKDPWNYWVFTLSLHSNFNGEESQKFGYFYGNVSANRTTDAWKLRAGINGSYNESDFSYLDENNAEVKSVSIRRSYGIEALVVKSYGAHWSAGGEVEAESSTFGNVELGIGGGPAVEYSVWPYSEATRRSLTLKYGVSIRNSEYRELTIYNKLSESHPVHEFDAELNLKKSFGSISVHGSFDQYLHNTSFYNASVFSDANIKLFKGFSINFFGEYARVHDQIGLAAGDLTPEEVLLQLRQRKTNYSYWGGFGISYSFGSIYNNVVNPRFGN